MGNLELFSVHKILHIYTESIETYSENTCTWKESIYVYGADEKRLLSYSPGTPRGTNLIILWEDELSLIGQSSSNRRHLFDTPYSQPTNDRSPTMVKYCGLSHGHRLFMTFLHLYEERHLQTCMQQHPDARVHCTAHALIKRSFLMHCNKCIICSRTQ